MEVPLDQRLLTMRSILVNFLSGFCYLGEGGGKKFMLNTHQKKEKILRTKDGLEREGISGITSMKRHFNVDVCV